MSLFRRRPRLDLGRYTSVPDAPHSPVESVVSDGVLIALSEVRMAIKNRMIVAAVRDGDDFDFRAHGGFAAERLVQLAAIESASARRVRDRIEAGSAAFDQDERAWRRRRENEWREDVHLRLAATLLETANDPAKLEEMLDAARYSALDEIALDAASRRGSIDGAALLADPDYELGRADRLAELVGVDLERLANERGVSLSADDSPHLSDGSIQDPNTVTGP